MAHTFNYARKEIKKKLKNELKKESKKIDNSINLEELINLAIQTYKKNNSKKRLLDIEKIKAILSENAEEKDVVKQLNKIKNQLKELFNSTEYLRGYRGRSYLEDCIHAALFLSEEIIYSGTSNSDELKEQALVRALQSLRAQGIHFEKTIEQAAQSLAIVTDENYSQALLDSEYLVSATEKEKTIINNTIKKGLRNLEPYAEHSFETIDYDYSIILKNAIKQYKDINLNISRKRAKNIEDILGIIDAQQGQQQTFDDINYYLAKNFSSLQSSRLRTYIKKAMADFKKRQKKNDNKATVTHQLSVKKWENKEAPSNKLVLALHGLQDSVDTFNGIAEQYVEAGYTVIAYDQSAHGYDERRNNKEKLNLQQMQFDFYQMLEKYVKDDGINEIVIVGHSLGGSIIANSLNTIADLNDEYKNDEDENKIKKIQLIAPAVMKNPVLQTIGNLPTLLFKNDGDKTESVKYATSKGLRRVGGPSPTQVFGEFIEFVANSFKSLRTVFNNIRSFSIPLEVHYAEDDGLVKASNFKNLQREQNKVKKTKSSRKGKEKLDDNQNQTTLVSYARGRHHLHAKNNYVDLRLIKSEEIENKYTTEEDEDFSVKKKKYLS